MGHNKDSFLIFFIYSVTLNSSLDLPYCVLIFFHCYYLAKEVFVLKYFTESKNHWGWKGPLEIV